MASDVPSPSFMLNLLFKPTRRGHLARIIRFAVVSGTGLALDVALFVMLVTAGSAPFVGSVLSSTAAVTFVYLASVRRIFRYDGRFIPFMFAAYSLYQFLGL